MVILRNQISSIQVGDVLDARVSRIMEIAKHKYLPISHQNPVASRIVELSVRPSVLALPAGKEPPTLLAYNTMHKVLFSYEMYIEP